MAPTIVTLVSCKELFAGNNESALLVPADAFKFATLSPFAGSELVVGTRVVTMEGLFAPTHEAPLDVYAKQRSFVRSGMYLYTAFLGHREVLSKDYHTITFSAPYKFIANDPNLDWSRKWALLEAVIEYAFLKCKKDATIEVTSGYFDRLREACKIIEKGQTKEAAMAASNPGKTGRYPEFLSRLVV
jgi:hypothetical protein